MNRADAEGHADWLHERPERDVPDAEELAWIEQESRR